MGLISFITGSDNRKHLKKLEAIALKVEDYEEEYKKLSDDQLKAKTEEFRRRYKENYETLDDLLPEAFATVREASARVLGMRHFHVQILGGITLHQGRIAEMRTGEGKTLVSTLPAYLNAVTGEGVHIVTVNDYLAKRDAEWMGKVHRFLGLTVGVAVSGMTPEAKRAAYNCDITYATNNELGFDYLRDNMVIYKEEMVQRKLSYAIIDEVDSILIDEARTPLIISGRGEKSSDLYIRANQFVKREIKEDDFEFDEKKKAINLTESGATKAETFFGIENFADIENSDIAHHVNNALRAHKIMKRDQDYIVSDGEVVIVDEFTGRLMVGRRYSDGLHQAIEAKENVTIRNENKTLATITFQNYFRLYDKLGGMTGTAKTEESEFKGIYGLDVVEIPTNVPSRRVDENDVIYTTVNGKLRAVIDDIKECTDRGQPVLVGTTNVEKSEELSRLLTGKRITHSVLNAKNHEKEAEIIAQAGRVGAVTIATNMAGRGTDILLGGNPEYAAKKRMRDLGVDEKLISAATAYFTTEDADVLAARAQYKKFYDEYKKEADEEKEKVIAVGGLRIIGTERHESRRIDNQLRGRAGRQGDMGSSIFYLSMEDDLLRLFGGDRMKRIAEMFHADEDTPFSMKLLTRQIANAQRNVEGRNYSIRKQVLEYDNVMNTQRTIIYKERNKVLQGESVHEQIDVMMHEQIEKIVDTYTDPKVDWNEWDYEGLNKEIERKLIPGDTTFLTEDRMEKWALEEIKEQVYTAMQTYYTQKTDNAKELGVDFEEIERVILLKVVDKQWMDHIDAMDALRRGIGLKAYGQQDPVIAYKQEGFAMFDDMIDRIHEETVALLMRVNVERAPKREGQNLDLVVSSGGSKQAKAPKANRSENKDVGRNDPCPCGSGKKYKNCCWDKDHK
ncbi:preprotein translocase subunit SecA [Pumilibacter intestinalis]|uniref:preprotein translocase subunit SecA n=1 Tax=Pumilibacter intestinalis TaxID=2941511 RepID=UPI002041653F|nr:preprotein translocase subunit SecA [Pumilibacter intestinalis]